MTSLTGGSPGGSGGRRAFTLIELLVVILVIGVLSAILTPILIKAREKAKVRWAQKELNELGAVISVYHRDHSAYPPDSGDWSANGGNTEDAVNVDEWSIHRYLGSKITNWRGEEYQPYMAMDWKRLVELDADKIGKFLDPFEMPYQLDAMHMIPPDPDDPGTDYRPCGWPYRLADKDNPSLQELQDMVLDYKFISYGPDALSEEAGDFRFDPQNPGAGTFRDDIRSWE